MIVIADTGPLNYLVLVQQADLLPRLFRRVLIPPAVFEELQDPETPIAVGEWLSQRPAWLEVQPLRREPDSRLDYLDSGEREAIALAEELRADQLLIDETDARREAERRNLPVIGTLGILRRASQLGWIDLPSILGRLRQTSFYIRPELIQALLAEDAERKDRS
jgi:predicted nucleic acid-binding protein